MAGVRVVVSNVFENPESKFDELITRAQEVRREPGCLQCEVFQGTEFTESLAQVEHWATQADFDGHCRLHGADVILLGDIEKLQSPYHHGPPAFPRRHGVNGMEFYHQNFFVQIEGTWTPLDPVIKSESIRWPAVNQPVRIVIQMTSDPAEDADDIAYSEETRQEPGCLQFDYYRSLEFQENKLHLELWDSPPALYDVHYLNRHLKRIWNIGAQRAPRPVERRYGEAGLEFYHLSFFTLLGSLWQPEDAALRMTTVRWP